MIIFFCFNEKTNFEQQLKAKKRGNGFKFSYITRSEEEKWFIN